MSDQPADQAVPSTPKPAADAAPETKEQRRRRLAAVFGDPLPDTTSDEREPTYPETERGADRWLLEQVPPHHGQ